MSKKLLYLLLVTLFLMGILVILPSSQPGKAQMSSACPAGMLNYWPFDKGGGQIANDFVDSVPLTLGMTPGNDLEDPTWSTGMISGALNFDGTDDFVWGGSLPQMSDGSIEAWIKRTGYGSHTSPAIISSIRPDTGGHAVEIMQTAQSGNIFGKQSFEFVKMDSTYMQIRLVTPDYSWDYNLPYHIVATWGSKWMRFYINGAETISKIYDGTTEIPNPTTDFIGSPSPVEIGDYTYYGRSGWQPMLGLIDEVAIYNRALTPTEVLQHYQNGLNGRGYCEQFTLLGFYPPVKIDGVYNKIDSGSSIPFKFEIFSGDTELTDPASVMGFTYAETNCGVVAIGAEIETTDTGGTSLRYDTTAGQFIYNWKTPKTPGKCYRVTMTTSEGSILVAYFKL